MYPILFEINGFNIYTHGVLAVVGIIAGSILIYLIAKKEKMNTSFFADNIVYSVLVGIIGARVAYYVVYRDQFLSYSEIYQLWEGGLVSYGGFLFGGLTFYFLIKNQKENTRKWFDIFAVGFFLGLFFGRLGNLAAGEHAGVVFEKGISINGVFPATFIESILCLLVFAFGLFSMKKLKLSSGKLFFILITVYGLGRFIIDVWRVEEKVVSFLSLGQIFDLAVVLFGIVGYLYLTRKVKYATG